MNETRVRKVFSAALALMLLVQEMQAGVLPMPIAMNPTIGVPLALRGIALQRAMPAPQASGVVNERRTPVRSISFTWRSVKSRAGAGAGQLQRIGALYSAGMSRAI